MDELNRDFISQVLLIIGGVWIGLALFDISNINPIDFIGGTILIFLSALIKSRHK